MAIATTYPTGLYGKSGWTVDTGVWEVIAQFTGVDEELENYHDINQIPDFLPFEGLGAQQAEKLLKLLPEDNLNDRQNYGPTARSLLQACVDNPDKIQLIGYYVGPSRGDERVSIEGFVAYSHEDYQVSRPHNIDCDCNRLWRDLAADYKLAGYESSPDELFSMRPHWNPGRIGWWTWWD